MIIKSLSRKTPSFAQLADYLSSDKADERFDIYRNCYARSAKDIAAEFLRNSERLQSRKNGNYLYHEIISLQVMPDADRQHFKERLRDIADSYVQTRCPRNLVFGCLHEDHVHNLHYHLMISANERGEQVRHRLSKKKFDTIKRELEVHVLEHYPELEQKVAIAKKSDRGRTKGEAELERRTGKRPKREEILGRINDAYTASMDVDSLHAALALNNLELYVRGKTLGVVDLETGKRHRLKTLDANLADQVELRMSGTETLRKKKSEQETEKAAKLDEQDKREDAEISPERQTDGKDNMSDTPSSSEPKKPSPERREAIDKGHVKTDPERDLLSHDEWRDQDKFLTKVQQSWRRTMDDLRGASKDGKQRDDGDKDR